MYYIIEHPRRGVLTSMDETDSGKVGRFSPTKSRSEGEHFATPEKAVKAREKITNANPHDCIIMAAPRAGQIEWTRALLGPVEEPRNA